MRFKAQGQQFLKKYVLDENLCTGCGACAGICPYQVVYRDRTVQLHQCDLENGRCFDYCPRTPADLQAIREMFFDQGDFTPEIGPVKGYFFSRAADPVLRETSQHGATVTALMETAIAEGWIDSAVVSSRNQDFGREGVMVRDADGLRKNAGSFFTVSPTVAAFHRCDAQGYGGIGVVATPCQALALAKMRFRPGEQDGEKIHRLRVVVGLYCGWTLSAEKINDLMRKENIAADSIIRMDVPAGKDILEIHAKDGVHGLAMDEVRRCIRPACLYCADSTAEFADVSVGSARFAGGWEEMRRWNQLIVRTKKGEDLVNLAVKKGKLELREAPPESFRELKKAAADKKRTALKNIIQKSGSGKNLLYLDRDDPVVKKYLDVRKKG